jgi:hypothetical protein
VSGHKLTPNWLIVHPTRVSPDWLYRNLLTTRLFTAIFQTGAEIAPQRVAPSSYRREQMKSQTKATAKTPPSKKANLKVPIKKSTSVLSPKLSANHNETLLAR